MGYGRLRKEGVESTIGSRQEGTGPEVQEGKTNERTWIWSNHHRNFGSDLRGGCPRGGIQCLVINRWRTDHRVENQGGFSCSRKEQLENEVIPASVVFDSTKNKRKHDDKSIHRGSETVTTEPLTETLSIPTGGLRDEKRRRGSTKKGSKKVLLKNT